MKTRRNFIKKTIIFCFFILLSCAEKNDKPVKSHLLMSQKDTLNIAAEELYSAFFLNLGEDTFNRFNINVDTTLITNLTEFYRLSEGNKAFTKKDLIKMRNPKNYLSQPFNVNHEVSSKIARSKNNKMVSTYSFSRPIVLSKNKIIIFGRLRIIRGGGIWTSVFKRKNGEWKMAKGITLIDY